MKLLLTSAGLTNKSITQALFEMVGKKPEETSLAFIPTAATGVAGDKEWLIEDLVNIKNQNFKSIDIVDISALSEDDWKPRLEAVDVLFFEGGSTYHLMEWIHKSGLKNLLPSLLQTRVYVGSSAGSCVTNKDLALELTHLLYDEDMWRTEEMAGLNYVDFYFLPHLDSKWFTKVRDEAIKDAIKNIKEKIYALDDESALKVVDGKVEIISEGKYLEYN